MKKVLVTGASGFIGNYVVPELLKSGCYVIASSMHKSGISQENWLNRIVYIPLDFGQFDPAINYFEYFQRPDLMIHLAWKGLPNYKSCFHIEKNLPRHIHLLDNIIRNGLKDLTVTGTCLEYGMQEGLLEENMQVFPANAYAIAKNEMRRSLEALQTKYRFLLKWVRLFYIYGKKQNPNSLLSQLDKALEDNRPVFNMSGGDQVRDYLPIEKVAQYLVKIALQDRVLGVINCC